MSTGTPSYHLMRIQHGNKWPYDAPDNWSGVTPIPAKDWAHVAARGILADLRGIKHSFSDIDEKTRIEIVETIAEIIRVAKDLKDGQL